MNHIDKVIKRLWAGTKINSKTGCWEWQLGKFTDGYGQIRFGLDKWRVHRLIAYICLGLKKDDKRQVLHRCDNPICWRPTHLYLGTAFNNMRDKVRRKRYAKFYRARSHKSVA